MSSMRVWALVVAVLMLASAAAAMLARPTRHLADEIGKPDLEQLFPRQFGDWRIDTNMPVVLPSPDVQAQLDKIYNQVLARTYVNSKGERIMLSVAYGGDQSDGTSAHRPEVCYPAQGFAIVSNQTATLSIDGQTVPVRRLVSRLGAREEPITYWIAVGGKAVTSGIEQKLAQMRYGLKGVIADGMLMRVSSIDHVPAHAFAVQDGFLADLAKVIDPRSRSRIFGRAT